MNIKAIASQHLNVTVLLEYIDLLTMCVNTILGTSLLDNTMIKLIKLKIELK